MIVSALLLPEVAAAAVRGRDDADLTRRFAAQLRRQAHLILVPMDEKLAEQATEVVAQHGLCGSDAVYAALLPCFGSTWVTLDEEQRYRVAEVIPTLLPIEALAEWS